MLASYLDFNSPSEYTFHLLTNRLSADAQRKLGEFARERCIDLRVMDVQPFLPIVAGLKVSGHVSLAAYFRLLIPDVVPADVERILYLDVDMVVLSDVAPLFEMPLERHAVAAVTDVAAKDCYRLHGLERPDDYFNSGMLMIDLAHWRRHGLQAEILRYAREHPDQLHFWDQCALNAALKNQVLYLDEKWNRQEQATDRYQSDLAGLKRDTCILHFSGSIKPWHYICEHPGKAIYLEYLRATPWRDYAFPDQTWRNRLKRVVPSSIRRKLRTLRL